MTGVAIDDNSVGCGHLDLAVNTVQKTASKQTVNHPVKGHERPAKSTDIGVKTRMDDEIVTA
jgi:hypothetical protein